MERERRKHAAALVAAGACVFGIAVAGTAAVDDSLRAAVAGDPPARGGPDRGERVAHHGPPPAVAADCDPRQRV